MSAGNFLFNAFRISTLLSLLSLPLFSYADANVGISPVTLTLTRQHATQMISFKNNGDKPHPSEIHNISLWQQINAKDTYTSTKDLIVLPPMFTIPPGATQVVRVAYLGKWNFNKELAYRIYFHQIHRYMESEDGESSVIGIDLNISLPMFVEPLGVKLNYNLSGTASIKKDKIIYNLKNSGNKHVKLTHIIITNTKGDKLVDVPITNYVLAGSTQALSQKIEFKDYNPSGHYKVIVKTDDFKTLDLPLVSVSEKDDKAVP